MLVGTSVCFRHQQSILPQGGSLHFSLPDCFLVFNIAFPCFGGRAASHGYCGDDERVREALAHHVNPVA
jgi:hypothetical protein